MFLGSRPASGTRIGTATWPYNADPVLLKNPAKSWPQGRNADYTSKWLPRTRLLNNHREGGLPDRLLLRITYEMAILQQQSLAIAPTPRLSLTCLHSRHSMFGT